MGSFLAEPYEIHEAGRFDELSKACMGVGAAAMAFAARRSCAAAVAGGALILAGAALERWSVFWASFESTHYPKYTVKLQRERPRQHEGSEDGTA